MVKCQHCHRVCRDQSYRSHRTSCPGPADGNVLHLGDEILSRLDKIEEALHANHQLPSPSPTKAHVSPMAVRAKKALYDWVAVHSIPFDSVKCPEFQEFINQLSPGTKLPGLKNLCADIRSYGKSLEYNLPTQTEETYCSLMTDGSRKIGKNWISLNAYTNNTMIFLGTVEVDDQKGATIGDVLAKATERLKRMNYIVTSVCTDNAENEIAALNRDRDGSLQDRTGLPILRVPCTSHTINLAIKDMMRSTGLEEQVMSVYHAIDTGISSAFRDRPTFVEVRWYSLAEVIHYIKVRVDVLRELFTKKRYLSALSALNQVDWPALDGVLQAMAAFVARSEEDGFSLFDVFPEFETCVGSLRALQGERNPYAEAMVTKLGGRFLETHDWLSIVVSYLVTFNGWRYYQQCPDGQIRESLTSTFKLGLSKLGAVFGSGDLASEAEQYLHAAIPEDFDLEANGGWIQTAEQGIQMSAGFIDLMKRMAEFPASEAGCERVFSLLRHLCGGYRWNLSSEMIQALMTIKMVRRMFSQPRDVRSVVGSLRAMVPGVT